jgi:GxxExxY protein
MYNSLSPFEEEIGKQIVDVAFTIHKALGPGLLESVYEKCYEYELKRRSVLVERQKVVPIIYNGLKMDDGLRLDLLVGDAVIVELKAQEIYHPVWEAQMLSYLKLSERRLGYIINFHVPLIKNGIKRMIL